MGAMSRKNLIVLEFNELTPRLMDQFINEGLLPNFARLRSESHVFVTDAAEHQDLLDPWIQWVTIHSGLSYAEHGVAHLNEGDKLTEPRVWDIVSRAGLKVWICGSMNVGFKHPIDGWILPDPWSSGDAYPRELNDFYHFVRRQVQEHSNESAPLRMSDALRFLFFLVSHGLSAGTVAAIVKQILAERSSDCRWKRAVLLDRMQWDLFCYHFRREGPAFSTFFLNSTAHFQHCYWRNLEPERFTIQPRDADQGRHKDSILFGYQEMDRIVGEALDLASGDTVLVMATGLSQQPYVSAEETGGKQAYRPHDIAKVPEIFGLGGVREVTPVMAEQFFIHHESEADARRSFALLKDVRTNGTRVFEEGCIELRGPEVFLGCSIRSELPEDSMLDLPGGRRARFFDVFYLIKDSMKSGMHHPDGMLWIHMPDRQHSEAKEKILLTSVAPTLLTLLDLPVPASMQRDNAVRI